MKKKETLDILNIIAGAYPEFHLSEPVINVWAELFWYDKFADVKAGLKYWIGTSRSSFAPKPSEIKGAMADLQGDDEGAELAWADKGGNTALGQEVWKVWGGNKRWGLLADPKMCDDKASVRQAAFATKEFIELYKQMATKQAATDHIELTHDESSKALGEINDHETTKGLPER